MVADSLYCLGTVVRTSIMELLLWVIILQTMMMKIHVRAVSLPGLVGTGFRKCFSDMKYNIKHRNFSNVNYHYFWDLNLLSSTLFGLVIYWIYPRNKRGTSLKKAIELDFWNGDLSRMYPNLAQCQLRVGLPTFPWKAESSCIKKQNKYSTICC